MHVHLTFVELESRLGALPAAPRDIGCVTMIVRRVDGARELPHSVELDPSEGLPGDDWNGRLPKKVDAQLAVMRRDVAELIANGQALSVFGDNLFVDLDLSAANLPAGTRLRVGGAQVEMTPLPHNGCAKFRARFGADALRFVQEPATRAENRRGVYWKVVTPGTVRVGDRIAVLARARS
jgi:MOSC domain-containing protein YiiM